VTLRVYNTLTRATEAFETVTPGHVGIYLCGPTVYKPSHIGHAVGPIIFDAIKRYLVHVGYQVTWVVNITDVDDKLIAEAAAQGCSTFELAERITADYLDAMKRLHVDAIDIMPKASEHMADIIAITQRLINNGVAYVSGGDVYFDVAKHPGYGKLSNRSTDDQIGQRELKSGEKRNAADFAVWKAAKPDEPDEVKFDSPWGKGRPGWHIECSAMAMRFLGETFDIHGGGMDLIFPHHENEIAQSEAANRKPFARYWLHNGLTRVNTKKISKSDASPEMVEALTKMTLRNLLRAVSPELVRFFVLSTHYRRPIEYSDEELDSKKKGLDTFYRLFERVERVARISPYQYATMFPSLGCTHPGALSEQVATRIAAISSSELLTASDEATAAFHRSMDDDFNTAAAIAALFDFAGAINRFVELNKLESDPRAEWNPGAPGARANSRNTGTDVKSVLSATARLIVLARIIGLFLEPPATGGAAEDGLADSAMQVLIQVRKHLRGKKDFETADLIRNLLTESKITLEDRPDGTVWRKG
jgi:cysteinyl-tRNA synthetase